MNSKCHLYVFLIWYDVTIHTLNVYRPAYATPKLLDKVGMKFSDIDVFEYHEAFAVSDYVL